MTCTYRDRRGKDRCTECGNQKDLCTCSEPDESAHRRLTSEHGMFLRAVFEKYEEVHSDHLFEKLTEQVGVLGSQLVRHDQTRSPSPDVIIKTLLDISATVTKLAVDGTAEYAYPST